MSSVIHYRFKAGSAEWSRIAFEGHATTLSELKRAIAEQRKLTPQQQQTIAGAGGEGGQQARTLQDFDLVILNVDTNEEYRGDQTVIPKNSSVIVKRVPAQRSKTLRIEAEAPDLPFSPAVSRVHAAQPLDSPAVKRQKVAATDAIAELHRRAGLSLGLGVSMGGGSAAVAGRGNDEFGDDPLDEWSYIAREEEQKQQAQKERAAQLAKEQKEAAEKQALLQQQQQAAAASAASSAPTPHPANAFAPPAPAPAQPSALPAGVYVRPPPSRPPPPHYKCHNCGQPGHWKQSCPTAAHLSVPTASKLLQQQRDLAALIYAPRTGTAPAAPLFNPAAVLPAAPSAPQHQPVGLSSALEVPRPVVPAAAPAPAPTAPELLCTLCTRLFDRPVVVPCCFTTFCDECIKQALVLESSKCPRCRSDAISAEQLRPNVVMQRRVDKEKQRLAGAAAS